jgi:hypothetical protein
MALRLQSTCTYFRTFVKGLSESGANPVSAPKQKREPVFSSVPEQFEETQTMHFKNMIPQHKKLGHLRTPR